MEWLAHLDSGSSISSNIISLRELLEEHKKNIVNFYWYDTLGMRLGCKIPPNCEIVVFKRNYVSVDNSKRTVFVLGWKSNILDGVETLAFLQLNGVGGTALVEMSNDREYVTTLERSIIEGK